MPILTPSPAPRVRDDRLLLDLPEAEFRRAIARKGIGGTDIGMILGLSRFGDAQECWERKMGMRAPIPTSGPMERGRMLEDTIADKFTRETGVRTRRQREVRHPEWPWWRGSPDRILVEPRPADAASALPNLTGSLFEIDVGVLEIKCLGLDGYRTARREGVHPGYFAQLQWYLGAANLSRGMFAIFNAEEWALWIPPAVERHDVFLAHARQAASTFWHDHVLTRTPPNPDAWPGRDAAHVGATIAAARTADAVDIEGDPAWEARCEALYRARASFALAERAKQDAERELRAFMAARGVTRARGYGWTLSLTEGTRRTLDAAMLRNAHPELDLDRFMRTTRTETFRATMRGAPDADE